MKWVSCEKRSAGIPVTVPLSQCLSCGECSNAIKSWLSVFPKINKNEQEQEEWLRKKAHKKGNCPRYREQVKGCTARRKRCPYAWFCAESSDDDIITFYVEDINMFIVERNDGTTTPLKERDIRKVELDSKVTRVYSITKKLVVTMLLVPVNDKNTVPAVKLPDSLKKNPALKKIKVFCQKTTKEPPEQMDLETFLKQVSESADMKGASAAMVDKEYVPQLEIKLENISTTPKRKRAPKSKEGADAK